MNSPSFFQDLHQGQGRAQQGDHRDKAASRSTRAPSCRTVSRSIRSTCSKAREIAPSDATSRLPSRLSSFVPRVLDPFLVELVVVAQIRVPKSSSPRNRHRASRPVNTSSGACSDDDRQDHKNDHVIFHAVKRRASVEDLAGQAAGKHGRNRQRRRGEARHAPAEKTEPARAVGVGGCQLEIQSRNAEEKPRPQAETSRASRAERSRGSGRLTKIYHQPAGVIVVPTRCQLEPWIPSTSDGPYQHGKEYRQNDDGPLDERATFRRR